MAELRLEPRVWLQSPVVPPLPSYHDLANQYPQFTIRLYDSRGATLQIAEGVYVLTGLCDVDACMTILFKLSRQTCFSLVTPSVRPMEGWASDFPPASLTGKTPVTQDAACRSRRDTARTLDSDIMAVSHASVLPSALSVTIS